MKTTAVLIAYPERKFVWALKRFERYLKSIGVSTDFVVAREAPIVVLSHIDRAVKAMSPEDTLLVIFDGHGNPNGWGIKTDPKMRASILPYSIITRIVSKTPGRLIFINDCCYGAWILRHLKPVRKPHNTCFIAPWDADDLSWGGATADVSRFWPTGKKPEDMISRNIYCSAKGDKVVPLLYRWGKRLDHYFFPPVSLMPT